MTSVLAAFALMAIGALVGYALASIDQRELTPAEDRHWSRLFEGLRWSETGEAVETFTMPEALLRKNRHPYDDLLVEYVITSPNLKLRLDN